MDGNSDYTYPRFKYDTVHSTASFNAMADEKQCCDMVVPVGYYTNVQTVLDSFKALSLTEPSTWRVRFHKHGFVITDVSYTDDDFNWFTSVEQAIEKQSKGLGIMLDEWRLTATSDRVLTKRDKLEIMRLYDGSDEMQLAHEMENVE
jgi:hypothetical protein